MISVKRLKELLSQLPEDAMCHGYEGEDTGISIHHENKFWFIRARESTEIDDHFEGEYVQVRQ
jgi:hypothetical protein